MASPLMLAKAVEGEPLYLYVAVSSAAVSGVLVREELGSQILILYISKTFEDAKN